MKNVLVSGCNGAMGQILCRLIEEDPDMQVKAGLDVNTYRNGYYQVASTPSELMPSDVCKADVIIDFSSHEATSALLDFAIKQEIPLVIGTTKISKKDEAKMEDAAKVIPIFYSQNMAYDICVFKRVLEVAVPLLKGADIEITEEHHRRKKDSPSGTAKMLAHIINDNLDIVREIVYGRTSKRDVDEIGISSVRGGTLCGTHTVKFIGDNDIFEIKHTALSRDMFAEGAIRAAKFITEEGRKPGLYTMDDLF